VISCFSCSSTSGSGLVRRWSGTTSWLNTGTRPSVCRCNSRTSHTQSLLLQPSTRIVQDQSTGHCAGTRLVACCGETSVWGALGSFNNLSKNLHCACLVRATYGSLQCNPTSMATISWNVFSLKQRINIASACQRFCNRPHVGQMTNSANLDPDVWQKQHSYGRENQELARRPPSDTTKHYLFQPQHHEHNVFMNRNTSCKGYPLQVFVGESCLANQLPGRTSHLTFSFSTPRAEECQAQGMASWSWYTTTFWYSRASTQREVSYHDLLIAVWRQH